MHQPTPRVAYFSMEIALESAISTYSGGLGVLAGDTIRSAADMELPLVAVTLLHRQGYFKQIIDSVGGQSESADKWPINDYLHKEHCSVEVTVEGRPVQVRAWRYDVKGHTGFVVPVYLLDTDVDGNGIWDRSITDSLYGGDLYYRICQEVVLGIGGIKLLRALNYSKVSKYHMNEGHSAFLVLELLQEEMRRRGLSNADRAAIESVHSRCVFTTHTPVDAGHDRFPLELASQVLGEHYHSKSTTIFGSSDELNMTSLAMNMSHYINGVAKKHGEVSKQMFSAYTIDSITNGVHAGTWVSDNFKKIYDHYIPDWQSDNFALRYALGIPTEEIWEAHRAEKRQLLDLIGEKTGHGLSLDKLTLGFARRATAYKRHDLLFTDLERLAHIAGESPGLQVVFAGKAHPQDESGKDMIRRVYEAQERLKGKIDIVYLPNYNWELAQYLIAGVDLWLNTPEPPLEASGTSGMKAALNGVPSFSVLDGWWIEGCIEGQTGWSIGTGRGAQKGEGARLADAESLYDKLQKVVLPTYYDNHSKFVEMMRLTIALNGSFFNTQRMVQQYIHKAYFRHS